MSDPFAGINYRRNFLKAVFIRVDLLSPLPGIEVALPAPLTVAAIPAFPIPEPRDIFNREIKFGPKGVVTSSEEQSKEWRFHGKERTKTLTIGPRVVAVKHTTYQAYENVKTEFIGILDQLADLFPDVKSQRVGLRYVNEIKLDEINPTSWSSYLAPQLLSVFEFPPEDHRPALSRVLHNLELSFADFNLRYRFGMHNPDYPAPIRQKLFILDFDAYTKSVVEIKEVGRLLDNFHACIQRYFEQSITDDLRSKLNGA